MTKRYNTRRRQHKWVVWKSKKRRLIRQLESRVPGLKVEFQGGMVPWQLEGTWHDYPCYMRYRHDSASMTVWLDKPWGDELLASTIDNWSGASVWAGSINSDEELYKICRDLTAALSPVSTANPSHYTVMKHTINTMVTAMKEQDARTAKADAEGDDEAGATDSAS